MAKVTFGDLDLSRFGDFFGTAGKAVGTETFEKGARNVAGSLLVELAKRQNENEFAKSFFLLINGARKLPGFEMFGRAVGGAAEWLVDFIPSAYLKPKTKAVIKALIPHLCFGAVDGLADADLEDLIDRTVDEKLGTPAAGTTAASVGEYEMAAVAPRVAGAHRVALNADGTVMKKENGNPVVPCELYASAEAMFEELNAQTTRWDNKLKKDVLVGGKLWKVEVHPIGIALAQKKFFCPVCMGNVGEVDLQKKASTATQPSVKNFDQASPLLIKVHVAVIRSVARRMRGTTSLSFTSVKYKNFEKFLEAVNNPATIRNVQVLEELAHQLEGKIEPDGTMPEEFMIEYITALDVSGAELAPFQEWKSTILSLFTDDEGGDQVATRRKQFIWTWVKRSIVGLLIAVLLLALPWLATLIGYPVLAIGLAMGLGLPLALLLLPVKAVEAVLDRVTEIAAGRDFHWGVNYARGLAWAIVLNMVLCVFINLADFAMFGRVVGTLAALLLSAWLFSAKSEERIGTWPILLAIVMLLVCGRAAVINDLRESAAFPVTVAWQAEFSDKGEQVNTLVVPLPGQRYEPALKVFGEKLSAALTDKCLLTEENKNNVSKQTEAKAQKKALVEHFTCDGAAGIVVLPKGTMVNLPGVLVKTVETPSGQQKYMINDSSLSIMGVDQLPDLSGKALFVILSIIICLVIGGVVRASMQRSYKDGLSAFSPDLAGLIATISAMLVAIFLGWLLFRGEVSKNDLPRASPVVRSIGTGGKKQGGKPKLTPRQQALCANWKELMANNQAAKAKFDKNCKSF
ncbi:hypothetical protein KJ611_03210 [Patescibacteria group bacterium]|nr:hypothetical protein [Patescibacteria group bacterium]MBU1705501.1 hypothetical protein [Patescibacteria group bacterium]